MVTVVAVVLENSEGEVLIARRNQGKLKGYWEFPGGKLDEGESPEETLVHELCEEMDVDIEVGEFLGENLHEYGEGSGL